MQGWTSDVVCSHGLCPPSRKIGGDYFSVGENCPPSPKIGDDYFSVGENNVAEKNSAITIHSTAEGFFHFKNHVYFLRLAEYFTCTLTQ